MYRQTLALSEKVLPKDHPDTLTSMYCLGHLLATRGQCEEAAALYERACAGYSKSLGDDHPTTRACREDYAEMLQTEKQGGHSLTTEDQTVRSAQR